ncbi:L-lactate dehydrogenase [Verruconis gallopava]|uniref:L-lactate dehydrogenase n=1 Tax=Verruconis gallopava TaxID=253628 RepID=A0A0D1Z377_9PEZI|nr:L-lactate dehydrogenase [Verruconis gallopava]KIW07397.1 L-lactate dehydrogenase [Verruconis gallopava]
MAGKLTSKIAVLGAGSVGSAVAYNLILNPIAGDILLVDPKEDMRDAQVQDLSDATYHGANTSRIRAGTHKEAGQCDIVVITAGAKQKQGESRTDLLGRNKAILKSAINDMKPFKENTVLLLVANPVDVLTYIAQQYSDLPPTQVIGTGTFLDSARLRGYIAEKTEIASSSIDAFVLGEHGESQFVAWSQATVAGVPLSKVVPEGLLDYEKIARDTKDKAANIINVKGATNYGIGAVTASICRSIIFDHRNIRPVSHWVDNLQCCLSLPAILGREGVVRTIPLMLSESEQEALENSAASMRRLIAEAEDA